MKMNFARTMGNLAVRFGDREALVNIERQRRYTFRELHALTNRIVNMMRDRLQLRRGDIGLCILENDNIALLHAWTALKGNAALAYTNYRDAQEEHRWQVDFIRPKVVFIENALLDRYFDMLRGQGVTVVCMDPPASLPAVQHEGLLYFWDLLDGVSDENPGIENDMREDALVYRFTGGTTGKSKCAAYTMDNWMAMRDSMYMESEQVYDADTRFLHMAPISHGSGLGLLPTLFRGGCTVTQNIPDLAQLCRNIEAEKITNTLLVPTMIYRILEMPEATQYDLSSLRTLAYGAAPMSPAKLRQAQQRFGNIFMQIYGATEILHAVGLLGKADHLTASDKQLGSAGRIVPGVEIMVVDEEGKELPQGSTGEIWLRCRGTISGYYNDPEATAAEFLNGFWKSGDLGYIDDEGFLYLVDRKKDMIITGGFNVYAVEVEAALNSHPAVSNSAVIGVPHEEWGEALHAEVVVKAGAQVTVDELIAHVKGRLGRFKIPKSIVFVEALPVSVVGKVLRRQVREKYWEGKGRRVS
ncbi:long-chain fatty acid--CoA ligase [Cupriavidus sp. SK-3]|uniref:class I adenylate-forming enzyme family protein n=1 Tax=Cupriavidus TaxID=106589 RepID=UPI000452BFEE|nr:MULTISPECIES: AMP-binding protein [Cupriavidus]KDP88489.1 long-chain fatty acid--CoA ligase [Cupriavidus sp. SK-3]MDF3887322.1 AMP-binding protein [Cupriavidus basilensis]